MTSGPSLQRSKSTEGVCVSVCVPTRTRVSASACGYIWCVHIWCVSLVNGDFWLIETFPHQPDNLEQKT